MDTIARLTELHAHAAVCGNERCTDEHGIAWDSLLDALLIERDAQRRVSARG